MELDMFMIMSMMCQTSR